jgi:hypothetical protein
MRLVSNGVSTPKDTYNDTIREVWRGADDHDGVCITTLMSSMVMGSKGGLTLLV